MRKTFVRMNDCGVLGQATELAALEHQMIAKKRHVVPPSGGSAE